MTATGVDLPLGHADPPAPRRGIGGWAWFGVTFAWDATFGIASAFVLELWRNGVIRLKGLTPAVQAIVATAMVLIVAIVVALVSVDRWRARSLLVAQTDGQVGRGTLFPQALLPVTLLLLAIGSALCLAGALRALKPLRILVVLVFGSFALEVRSTGDTLGGGHDWRHWAGWAAVGVIAAVFAAAPKLRPRPALELAVLLGATLTVFAVAESQLVGFDRFAGTSVASDHFDVIAIDVRNLTLPLIFAAGLSVVAFAVTSGGWVIEFVDRRVPRAGVLALLGALLAWRVHDLGPEILHTASHGAVRRVIGGYAGAIGLVAVVAAMWWVVARAAAGHRATDDVVEDDELEVGWTAARAALPLACALTVVVLALLVAQFVLEAVGTFSAGLGRSMAHADVHVTDALSTASLINTERIVVCVIGILAAPLLARRGKRILGLYVGIVAANLLYSQITVGWGRFTTLRWTTEQADEVWLVAVVGLAAWWLLTRGLSTARAERLLYVGLIGALMRQSTFVSNPFSLVTGVTSTGFVVSGLLWGFLTVGTWANAGSRAFPRSSRVFLYLGYTLFSVTLLAYFASSHQIGATRLLEDTQPTNGLALLGLPLVYALYAVMVSGAVDDRPLQLTKAEEEEEERGEAELSVPAGAAPR